MAYGIVDLRAVAAHNVDSYNRTFISDDDIENGSIIGMGARVSGENNEYVAVKPATANLAKQFYMVASPIRVITELADGNQFVDLSMNPKNFINVAGEPIDGVALQIGDIVRLSEDAIAGTKEANTAIVATDGSYQLTWGSAISGLTLDLLDTTYISIADGFGSQRTTAYDFVVSALA